MTLCHCKTFKTKNSRNIRHETQLHFFPQDKVLGVLFKTHTRCVGWEEAGWGHEPRFPLPRCNILCPRHTVTIHAQGLQSYRNGEGTKCPHHTGTIAGTLSVWPIGPGPMRHPLPSPLRYGSRSRPSIVPEWRRQYVPFSHRSPLCRQTCRS